MATCNSRILYCIVTLVILMHASPHILYAGPIPNFPIDTIEKDSIEILVVRVVEVVQEKTEKDPNTPLVQKYGEINFFLSTCEVIGRFKGKYDIGNKINIEFYSPVHSVVGLFPQLLRNNEVAIVFLKRAEGNKNTYTFTYDFRCVIDLHDGNLQKTPDNLSLADWIAFHLVNNIQNKSASQVANTVFVLNEINKQVANDKLSILAKSDNVDIKCIAMKALIQQDQLQYVDTSIDAILSIERPAGYAMELAWIFPKHASMVKTEKIRKLVDMHYEPIDEVCSSIIREKATPDMLPLLMEYLPNPNQSISYDAASTFYKIIDVSRPSIGIFQEHRDEIVSVIIKWWNGSEKVKIDQLRIKIQPYLKLGDNLIHAPSLKLEPIESEIPKLNNPDNIVDSLKGNIREAEDPPTVTSPMPIDIK